METEGVIDNKLIKKELLEILEEVEFYVEKLIEVLRIKIERQRDKANKLGIKTFNSQTLLPEIETYLAQIKQSIKEMKRRLEQGELTGSDIDLDIFLENYNQARKKAREDLTELLEQYQKMSKKDLRITLDTKVRETIYKMEYDRLSKEKNFLTFKPQTLLGRILGEARLRKARLRNLEVRIARAEINRRKVSSTRRVEDMLMELYEYSDGYYNGILTDEMQGIEEGIRQTFNNVSSRKKIMAGVVRNQSLAVSEKKERMFWARNRKEANRLNEETRQIEQENKAEETATQEESPYKTLTTVYGEIKSILDAIKTLVESKEKVLTASIEQYVPEP